MSHWYYYYYSLSFWIFIHSFIHCHSLIVSSFLPSPLFFSISLSTFLFDNLISNNTIGKIFEVKKKKSLKINYYYYYFQVFPVSRIFFFGEFSSIHINYYYHRHFIICLKIKTIKRENKNKNNQKGK